MLHRNIHLAALLLAMLFASVYSRKLLTLDSTTAAEATAALESATVADEATKVDTTSAVDTK
jgi:hypothetical protein